jgi:TRAP-type C4-dicarboxylate transport system permease large subunit
VETAALTVVYIFLVEVYLYKDIRLRDLPTIVIDCATLIGGVLIILV